MRLLVSIHVASSWSWPHHTCMHTHTDIAVGLTRAVVVVAATIPSPKLMQHTRSAHRNGVVAIQHAEQHCVYSKTRWIANRMAE